MRKIIIFLIFLLSACTSSPSIQNNNTEYQNIPNNTQQKCEIYIEEISRIQQEIQMMLDYNMNEENPSEAEKVIQEIFNKIIILKSFKQNIYSLACSNSDSQICEIYSEEKKETIQLLQELQRLFNNETSVEKKEKILTLINEYELELDQIEVLLSTECSKISFSNNDNKYIYNNYECEETNLNFIQITNVDVISDDVLPENEGFVLLVMRNDCPSCQDFLDSIIGEEDYILQYINTFYFLDTTKLKDSEKKVFKDKYSVDQVPSVLFFDDGKKCYATVTGMTEFRDFVDKLISMKSN